MFEPQDFVRFRSLGMDLDVIEKQLLNFESGFPFVTLDRPATAGDGILTFSDEEVSEYEQIFDRKIAGEKVLKFVPASGAASRMFKKLFEFRELYRPGEEVQPEMLGDRGFNSAWYLFSNIRKIAFFRALNGIALSKGTDVQTLLEEDQLTALAGMILDHGGLNYSNLPKGLILFHDYPEGARTAAEEHLVEAISYARDRQGVARIHFTISPEHKEKFTELFNRIVGPYEQRYGTRLEITWSHQEPSTDTLAVDENNLPFRNPDGSLLFRPGGHGALLGNLNRLDADIIFIKNIDNIVPDRLKPETFLYKKVIGGFLLEMRGKVFEFLGKAEAGIITEEEISEMASFCMKKLSLPLLPDFDELSQSQKLHFLTHALDRPMRVCGMVRNEGEPGGGPFWVRDRNNHVSLQIIESSQVNQGDAAQLAIMQSSTHFNPVDIVCCIRNYKGRTFDLKRFVDENTGFISLKSSGGRNLKAQELPGLWNGAMAGWITVFVDVPVSTFNPVKTVNDLLRAEHLS